MRNSRWLAVLVALIVARFGIGEEKPPELLHQFTFEIRFLDVTEKTYQQINQQILKKTATKQQLTPDQVSALLKRAQTDPESSVLLSPKITVLDSKVGKMSMGRNRKFVTGALLKSDRGALTIAPQEQMLFEGTQLSVQATFLPKNDRILMKLQAEIATSKPTVKYVPVTNTYGKPLTKKQMASGKFQLPAKGLPAAGGEEEAEPRTFTQFIQQVEANSIHFNEMTMVKPGRSLLLVSQPQAKTVTKRHPLPVFGQLPLVGKWFVCKTVKMKKSRVVVLISPKHWKVTE